MALAASTAIATVTRTYKRPVRSAYLNSGFDGDLGVPVPVAGDVGVTGVSTGGFAGALPEGSDTAGAYIEALIGLLLEFFAVFSAGVVAFVT